MKIAILMSTYNGESFLEEQIESILNQTCSDNITLLIRDDGSTDKTVSILENYSKKNKNIKYTVGKSEGAARSFITLLKENMGYDFYAFSDQDDVWNSDKLQRGLSKIRSINRPALYCSNCELVDENLKSLGRLTHRKVPTYNLVSILCLNSCAQGCTSIFNRELAEIVQYNNLPETIIMHDSFITCLCAMIGGEIVYDHNSTMKYRMHNNNVFGMVTLKQNFAKTIKNRYKEITTKRKISMSDQVDSILNVFNPYVSQEHKKICDIVVKAKFSKLDRLKLFFNPDLKHDTLNKTLTKKLEILLGNG
uniref:Glycosyltransferase n=1 Tax=Streptococcus suis TaxID=1307 RepID=M1VRE8_STRSU|nr:glycosyltransferase [Streptococcus suis]